MFIMPSHTTVQASLETYPVPADMTCHPWQSTPGASSHEVPLCPEQSAIPQPLLMFATHDGSQPPLVDVELPRERAGVNLPTTRSGDEVVRPALSTSDPRYKEHPSADFRLAVSYLKKMTSEDVPSWREVFSIAFVVIVRIVSPPECHVETVLPEEEPTGAFAMSYCPWQVM